MTDDIERRLSDALGALCQVCGAVMNEIIVVSNKSRTTVFKCEYCGHREEINE